MAWPLLRAVDSLDRGRVLFDFNPGRDTADERWVSAADFDYGVPEWDSSSVGVVEGSRTLTVVVCSRGRAAEAGQAVLSEILTRTAPVYLQWQTRKDSESLWFRLHRQTSGGALDWSTVWADDRDSSVLRWKITLEADAFALGAREDITCGTQLAAAGSPIMPPAEITCPIKGTAPAPLCVDVNAGYLAGYSAQVMSWAADPAASVDPWAGTTGLGLAFGAQTAFESMGGLPHRIAPGTYRALLYVTRTSTTGSCRMSVQAIGSGSTVGFGTAPRTSAPIAGPKFDGWWLDCGRLSLPAGVDVSDMAEDALPDDLTFRVTYDYNGSDAGTWNVRNFTLAPIQTTSSRAAATVLQATMRGAWPVGARLRVDSERNRVGLVDAGGRWQVTQPVVVDGAFPRVHPGARNFVMFLPRMSPVVAPSAGYGSAGESKMWYYPRYAQLGCR